VGRGIVQTAIINNSLRLEPEYPQPSLLALLDTDHELPTIDVVLGLLTTEPRDQREVANLSWMI
jgi:hypothetical protein